MITFQHRAPARRIQVMVLIKSQRRKLMGEMRSPNEARIVRCEEHRDFLKGREPSRSFFHVDPSSFAAIYAGKTSGHPDLKDLISFHSAFESDAPISIPLNISGVIKSLCWEERIIKTAADGTVFLEETIATPYGRFRRVVADSPGTTPWLAEPAIQKEDDFRLADFYAEQMIEHASILKETIEPLTGHLRAEGFQPAITLFTAFELQYLVDYADMPIFYMDWPERYIKAVENMHMANMGLLEVLAGAGVELFYTGSAGLELLSPGIFKNAIVPFQREFNDRARQLGRFVVYHICGHSRLLIEQKIIDNIKPTVFETCSGPPCGNNNDLRESVFNVSEEIITKGNLPLETLRNGTPDEIREYVCGIKKSVSGRRHIVGQADGTILDGTPLENIKTYIETAMD